MPFSAACNVTVMHESVVNCSRLGRNWHCDRKAQAVSAQSFTLWQQATIEITRWDHSIIACWHHIYIIYGCYSLHTSRSWWIAHIQCNANGEVTTKHTKPKT